VKTLKCPDQIVELMHDYLDEERENEMLLREHLQGCKECETIFNELKKTIAFEIGRAHV
jgi:predicted anti-sigma-YlaC factor YlaD